MDFSVFIATSLDGYIATPDGGIDWLTEAGTPGESEEFGFSSFFSSVDVMIMGRNTLEIVLSFGVDWPYEGKRVIVLSKTMNEIPKELAGKIELYHGSILALAGKLRSEGYKRAYIDGGKTVQSFLREGLITDLTITRVPIILGKGLPLFGELAAPIRLEHLKTGELDSGFTASTYRVK